MYRSLLVAYEHSSELGALNTKHGTLLCSLNIYKTFRYRCIWAKFQFCQMFVIVQIVELVSLLNVIRDSMENETKPCISIHNESKLIADLRRMTAIEGQATKDFLEAPKTIRHSIKR